MNLGGGLMKALAIALSFSLTWAPIPLVAQTPASQPTEDLHVVDGFIPSSGQHGFNLEEQSKGHSADALVELGLHKFQLESTDNFREALMDFYNEILQEGQKLEQKMGVEAFKSSLYRRESPTFTRKGFGIGSLTLIDNAPCVRIVVEANQKAYLFLSLQTINPESAHLKRYLSRIHLDAGDGNGRDAVVVWLNQVNAPQFVASDKISALRGPISQLKEYWGAIYEKPKWGDHAFGAVSALTQVGVLMSLSWLQTHVDPSAHPITPLQYYMTAFYGYTLNSLSSTYRNWLSRGALGGFFQSKDSAIPINTDSIGKHGAKKTLSNIDWMKTLTSSTARSTANSLTYSYSFLLIKFASEVGQSSAQQITFMDPASALSTLSLFAWGFLAAQAVAIPNAIFNNINKIYVAMPTILRHIAGENNKPILKYEIKHKDGTSTVIEGPERYAVENMVRYQINSNILKTIGLMGIFGTWTSNALIALSIPPFHLDSVRAAKRLYQKYPDNKALKKQHDEVVMKFESSWYGKSFRRFFPKTYERLMNPDNSVISALTSIGAQVKTEDNTHKKAPRCGGLL